VAKTIYTYVSKCKNDKIKKNAFCGSQKDWSLTSRFYLNFVGPLRANLNIVLTKEIKNIFNEGVII
jgi:hypothetical protein